jgi:hypothetical protein
MKRAAGLLLALLAPAGAHANGFIDASLGLSLREPDHGFDFDTGTVARLELGTRYDTGLMLRVAYGHSGYDSIRMGGARLAEDVVAQDARGGVFYATPQGAPLGWRLGGGYVYAGEDDSESARRSQRGGFVEAAAVAEATPRITLELAAAVMKLAGEYDYDAQAAEVRALAAFHTGAMDFTVGARYARYDRESLFDEQVFELRVGVGGGWAYPEGARY